MSNKKKILILGDHPYTSSGVGVSIKYFLYSMLETGKYQFICLGGALRHASMQPVKDEKYGEDLVIYPVEGYGTKIQVKEAIEVFKIDAIWFMTDPRYWVWLWEFDNEIRHKVPMLYYHVWDNFPAPHYNKPLYLSNDMIVTMSQVSSDIVKEVSPEVDEVYIPLTVDTDIFKPLPKKDWELIKPANRTLFFWNNRNARRKMSGTILWWYKEFLDIVGRDKACLLMHTDPNDPHGQNLQEIAKHLGLTREQYLISPGRITQDKLALMYNAADCVLNISDAEGVGLGTMEALACETPIIVNMTGGLQEQVTDGKNWFGIGIEPAVKTIVGGQDTPYIYEDRVAKKDFIDALIKMHNMKPEERKEMGKMGRKHILNKYDLSNFAKSWEKVLDNFLEKHGSWENRKLYSRWTLKEY